ncbi:hypothetical protein H8D85_01445 [bacterium]|nr:hypothetical protein [bacterium]
MVNVLIGMLYIYLFTGTVWAIAYALYFDKDNVVADILGGVNYRSGASDVFISLCIIVLYAMLIILIWPMVAGRAIRNGFNPF